VTLNSAINSFVAYGLNPFFSYVLRLNTRWLDSESLVFVSLARFVPRGICRRRLRHTYSPNDEFFETTSGEGHVARLGEPLNWCVLRQYGTSWKLDMQLRISKSGVVRPQQQLRGNRLLTWGAQLVALQAPSRDRAWYRPFPARYGRHHAASTSMVRCSSKTRSPCRKSRRRTRRSFHNSRIRSRPSDQRPSM
jgi:hypothetical protein